MNGHRGAANLLKEQGSAKTRVTQIQEKNLKWAVSVHQQSLVKHSLVNITQPILINIDTFWTLYMLIYVNEATDRMEKMTRNYRKRQTEAQLPQMILREQQGNCQKRRSIRSVAKDHKVDRVTLNRYINKTSYARLAQAHQIFDDNIESELASHIKKPAGQCHGLSPLKCRELVFELAGRNGISITPSPCSFYPYFGLAFLMGHCSKTIIVR